jgi:hypothetical protein
VRRSLVFSDRQTSPWPTTARSARDLLADPVGDFWSAIAGFAGGEPPPDAVDAIPLLGLWKQNCFHCGDRATRNGMVRKYWKPSCFHGRRGIEAKMSKKTLFLIGLALALAARPVSAQPKYDPGASDTEIKIGNVAPYSGPVSLYGAVGKVEAAFFKMVNDQGGINGRKVNFISYDDAYSPPKTLEQTAASGGE